MSPGAGYLEHPPAWAASAASLDSLSRTGSEQLAKSCAPGSRDLCRSSGAALVSVGAVRFGRLTSARYCSQMHFSLALRNQPLFSKKDSSMAQVTHRLFATGKAMYPGQTHHWWWNNSPGQRVWMFSVDPLPISNNIQATLSYRIEVTKVEYRRNHAANIFEREIHVWVKNTGTEVSDYQIYMATVGA